LELTEAGLEASIKLQGSAGTIPTPRAVSPDMEELVRLASLRVAKHSPWIRCNFHAVYCRSDRHVGQLVRKKRERAGRFAASHQPDRFESTKLPETIPVPRFTRSCGASRRDHESVSLNGDSPSRSSVIIPVAVGSLFEIAGLSGVGA
jgi:hypothetical protein